MHLSYFCFIEIWSSNYFSRQLWIMQRMSQFTWNSKSLIGTILKVKLHLFKFCLFPPPSRSGWGTWYCWLTQQDRRKDQIFFGGQLWYKVIWKIWEAKGSRISGWSTSWIHDACCNLNNLVRHIVLLSKINVTYIVTGVPEQASPAKPTWPQFAFNFPNS